MRATILSAGQGKRLLPLTATTPKCLLPVRGDQPCLEVQLRALAECGIDEASVVVGFGADQVDAFLATNPVPGIRVKTVYNPFFRISDNLISCWAAQTEMQDDFVHMNGDTLFETKVLERLLATPPAPLTLVINEKAEYDADDMKVSVDGGRRLRAVGKTLDPEIVNGESIGLMYFRNPGPANFRSALNAAVREPESLKRWYLSVVNEMAATIRVATVAITGLWWGELDYPEDLSEVRAYLGRAEQKRKAPVHPPPEPPRVTPPS
jgi:choline kinase